MKNIIPIMVVLAVLLVPTGFAVSYNGVATCSCGSLDGSCITVESYVYDGGEYTPSAIITEKALVTKGNTNYTLNANNVKISAEDLYLKITGIGYDGSINLSCAFSVTGVGSCTAKLDGSAFTSGTVTQGYHSFEVLYSGSYNANTKPMRLS